MRVMIVPDAEALSQRAATIVADLVRRKPSCVLGLATGGTPLGLYAQLIRLHQQAQLDFSQVTTFNLDEYAGLSADHPQSYRTFMQEHFFQHVNVPSENIHIPDGLAEDFALHARKYEERIIQAGGIDLQVLGIGTDGHIAFNEPGSSLGSRTRLTVLAAQTRQDNARFFGSIEEVPCLAITMGVGTILESRQCLLLASGRQKAEAILATVEGPLTSQVTASALQMHPETIIVVDEQAASFLRRRQYYNQVEEVHRQLENGQLALHHAPNSRPRKTLPRATQSQNNQTSQQPQRKKKSPGKQKKS